MWIYKYYFVFEHIFPVLKLQLITGINVPEL